jgi:TatD DNase family protein
MFIDSHSHLQLEKSYPDTEAVLRNAENSNVKGQIIIGYNLEVSQKAIEMANKFANRNLFAAIGIHPHDADEVNPDAILRLKEMAKTNKKVVAIGEIGLDYFRNLKPVELQQKSFIMQLKLAVELDLPVILHVRDAWEDVLEMLKDYRLKDVVMHSFTGNFNVAQTCIERGYYLSFSGMLTYPKNEDMRDITKITPLDKILIETDCPYLPPQKYRGQVNEPAYVVEVAKTLAEVNNMKLEEIEELTTNNAKNLFNLDI